MCGPHCRDGSNGEGTCVTHVLTKGAVRISQAKKLYVHEHWLKSGRNHKEHDALQLNHYAIQSKEYFEKIKMTRGDVNRERSDFARNWHYFDSYDKIGSGCRDIELCSILDCCTS